jgi:hypothetical protein
LRNPKGLTVIPEERDAWAFLDAAGIKSSRQQRAVIELVRGLKHAQLWSKMKAIYPFVGGTATTHKFNLKDPRDADAAFRLSFSGGWTHASTGIKGNGTNAFANTYLVPNTKLSENSTHLSVYSRTNQGRNEIEVGTYGTADPSFYSIIVRWGDNRSEVYMYNWQNNYITNTNHTNSVGLYLGTRTASNVLKMYRNDSQFGTTNTNNSAQFTLLTNPIYLAARYYLGSAEFFSSKELAFATIGDGLSDTDVTAFYNIIQRYQTSLGRQV